MKKVFMLLLEKQYSFFMNVCQKLLFRHSESKMHFLEAGTNLGIP